jgi:hypothetical protein
VRAFYREVLYDLGVNGLAHVLCARLTGKFRAQYVEVESRRIVEFVELSPRGVFLYVLFRSLHSTLIQLVLYLQDTRFKNSSVSHVPKHTQHGDTAM